MKLFKKLAAAALAAVLALSMVGCGNASGVNSTKQFILNLMSDAAVMTDTECHNTPELDGIAQKLLTEANAAYQDKTQTDKTVGALMQAATEKEGVLKENTGYDISFVEDYKFKCSIIPEAQKQEMLMRMMDTIYVNSGVDRDATKRDVGVAVGKIGVRKARPSTDARPAVRRASPVLPPPQAAPSCRSIPNTDAKCPSPSHASARVTASVAPGASASVRPTPLQALPSTCTASWRSVARAARSACQPVPWTRSTWSKTEGRGRWRMRTGRESTIGMPQPAASASRLRTAPDSTHSESLRLKRPPAAPPRLSRTSWLEPAVQTPATTEED